MPKIDVPQPANISNAPLASGQAQPSDFSYGPQLERLGSTMGETGVSIFQTEVQNDYRDTLVQNYALRSSGAQEIEAARLSGAPLEPIQEKYRDQIAKITESATTRKGQQLAAIHGSETDQYLTRQIYNLKAYRADEEAKQQMVDFGTHSGAQLARDPSLLPQVEKDADTLANSFIGRKSPQAVEYMRTELKQTANYNAVYPQALQNPGPTFADLQDGKYYLSGPQRGKLSGTAEYQLRWERSQQSYNDAQVRMQIRDTSDAAVLEHMEEIDKGNINYTKYNQDTVNNGGRLTEQGLRAVTLWAHEHINWINGQAKQPNEPLYNSLLTGVNAKDNDPHKIWDQQPILDALNQPKGINGAQAKDLLGQLHAGRDADGATVARRISEYTTSFDNALRNNEVEKAYAQTDPTRIARMENQYHNDIRARRESLKNIPGENPNSVFDETSKNWVGTSEFMNNSIMKAKAAGLSLNDVNKQKYPGAPDLGTKTVLKSGKTIYYHGGPFIGADSGNSYTDKP